MTENQAREEICRIGQSLFERGYAHATAGNISVRMDDGYLITPTDACLGFLDPARLARLDTQGRQTDGDMASKTLVLHQHIYAATSAANFAARCVIHTHSTHLVALSLLENEVAGPCGYAELLPPITPYFVMKVGHVPHLPYYRPGAKQAAEAVATAIKSYAANHIELRAVMLARLGPNVWSSSPSGAMAVLEELEETARLWLLTQSRPSSLAESAIGELKSAFNAQW
jgi:3-dehydro-4-phosphotetronate decarboxylase